MPFMLELACLLSFAVQDFADGAILLAMILLNALLGFREQLHAKKALDARGGVLGARRGSRALPRHGASMPS